MSPGPVANQLSHPSLLALSSALLLTFAFPNFNQPWCAWIALVPWLLLLRACSLRAAFWWSCHVGMLFFLCSIWWLVHVTLVGLVLLCGILALYFGLFGLGVAYIKKCQALEVPGTSSAWHFLHVFWRRG